MTRWLIVLGAAMAVLMLGLAMVAGGESDKVEDAVRARVPADVVVVKNSCSRRGETASGYEHWVCVVSYPDTVLGEGRNTEVDVAWDDGRLVTVR